MPMLLLVTALFGAFAQIILKDTGLWAKRCVALSAALSVVPSYALLGHMAPDYALGYLFDPEVYPNINSLTPFLALASASAGMLAYALGGFLQRHAQTTLPGILKLWPLPALSIAASLFYLYAPRTICIVTSYVNFWAGDGSYLWYSPVGWQNGFMLFVSIALSILQRNAVTQISSWLHTP